MTTITLTTEQEKRDYAKQAAAEMISGLRESNAYEARTGNQSTVSEAEYEKAAGEIETSLLRAAGLKPLKPTH